MLRTRVQSTSIASMGYDPRDRVLEVEFINGGVYEYLGVSPEEYRALLAAPSRGAYLNRVIKRKYEYRKI
jgi:hypothetical protein